LKEIRSEETVAEYSFTGIATSPKEIVSEAIDRACVTMLKPSLETQACYQTAFQCAFQAKYSKIRR
jgi:hypothetical protein